MPFWTEELQHKWRLLIQRSKMFQGTSTEPKRERQKLLLWSSWSEELRWPSLTKECKNMPGDQGLWCCQGEPSSDFSSLDHGIEFDNDWKSWNYRRRKQKRAPWNNSHALKCECTPYNVTGKLLTLFWPHSDLLTSNKSPPKKLRKSFSQC